MLFVPVDIKQACDRMVTASLTSAAALAHPPLTAAPFILIPMSPSIFGLPLSCCAIISDDVFLPTFALTRIAPFDPEADMEHPDLSGGWWASQAGHAQLHAQLRATLDPREIDLQREACFSSISVV